MAKRNLPWQLTHLLEIMTFKDVTDVLLRILIGGWDMSLEILLKKSTILIVIVLVAQVDRMLGTDNHVFCNCTALSFTVNDALSVMHGSRMNLTNNFLEIVIIVGTMTAAACDRHFVIHRL